MSDSAIPRETLLSDSFTDEERRRLAPYFTNLSSPVFALINLPDTVKGALFARYSRSAKSLRRLFLDEFLDKLDAHETRDEVVGLGALNNSTPECSANMETIRSPSSAAPIWRARACRTF